MGVGHEPGIGAGSGGGIGGGVYKVGAGISAPQAISSPGPDYTEEARRAKETRNLYTFLDRRFCGTPARHPRGSRLRPRAGRQGG